MSLINSDENNFQDQNSFSLSEYRHILNYFKEIGYSIKNLGEISKNEVGNPIVYLRHDIDVDLFSAIELARIEREENINPLLFYVKVSFLYLISDVGEEVINNIYKMDMK